MSERSVSEIRSFGSEPPRLDTASADASPPDDAAPAGSGSASDEPGADDRVSVRGAEPGEEQRDAPEDVAREAPTEIGGRKGLDPVRYGDWEKNGRCIDF